MQETTIEIGTIVHILIGEFRGQPGRVYNHCPGLLHEWHVRPLQNWPEDCPGIAYASHEITTNAAPGCGRTIDEQYR